MWVLANRFKSNLQRLNKQLPEEYIDYAVSEITKSRAIMLLLRANMEVYELIKNGVQVDYKNTECKEVNE